MEEDDKVVENELGKVLEEMRDAQQKYAIAYDEEANKFWESLSDQDKLKAFYAVTKRIYKGELEDQGSYRHVLYRVFGFSTDAYKIGMMSGYFAVHNSIDTSSEFNKTLIETLHK